MGARAWARRIVGLGTIVLVVVAASGAATDSSSSAQQELEQIDRSGREIQAFFSRRPESDDDFTAVFPVSRTSPDAGVASAALRALIAGPTPAEADEGYFSVLGSMLVGPSTCGGPDFTIRIESGLATVQFCRVVSSEGVGQDARAMSSLDATLRQFSTVQRVRLLTSDGDCLFEMSGENRCLRTP